MSISSLGSNYMGNSLPCFPHADDRMILLMRKSCQKKKKREKKNLRKKKNIFDKTSTSDTVWLLMVASVQGSKLVLAADPSLAYFIPLGKLFPLMSI